MDALDAEPVADWWARALGFERLYRRDPYVVIGPPSGDHRPRLVIQQVETVAPGKTPVHLDLRVDEPDAEVDRLARSSGSVGGMGRSTRRRWVHPLDHDVRSVGHAVLRLSRSC